MDYSYFQETNGTEKSGPNQFVLVTALVASFLSLLCLLFLLYTGRMDRLTYHPTLMIVPILVVMVVIPVLSFLLGTSIAKLITRPSVSRLEHIRNTLKRDRIRNIVIIAGFASVLNAPLYAYWSGKRELDVYKKAGVRTKAIVTRSWEGKGRRMDYDFIANGVLYTATSVHNAGNHFAGDSIDVIYNTQSPYMNEAWENVRKDF